MGIDTMIQRIDKGNTLRRSDAGVPEYSRSDAGVLTLTLDYTVIKIEGNYWNLKAQLSRIQNEK